MARMTDEALKRLQIQPLAPKYLACVSQKVANDVVAGPFRDTTILPRKLSHADFTTIIEDE
jgi:hypothetical protein